MSKDHGEYFNIAHIEPFSHIYGPGERFVVWFQGCSLACKGCWNRDMWSFKSNNLIHKNELLKMILQAPDIKGVTFLGGEPLHQSDNLFWLIGRLRKLSNLTVFLFTGYEEDELETLNHMYNIKKYCDIAAIGRYKEEFLNINQQWVGSDNQKIIYTENSRESIQPENINQVEIIIDNNESVRILGFPDEALKGEFI